jgi:hypothetical protein
MFPVLIFLAIGIITNSLLRGEYTRKNGGNMKKTWILLLSLLATSAAWGHPNYTGYSGAPGTSGRCSVSCHHRRNFAPSMTVTGFPESYIPGQSYTIAVAHQSGSSIRQFNSSIRIGTGSENAGRISSSTNTTIYSVSTETNGVHFSSTNLDNGTFYWLAPAAGTGSVRLYFAGLQGSLSNGADTSFYLTSVESSTGIEDSGLPQAFSLEQNYPNPFNSSTVINFSLAKPGHVEFSIYDLTGRTINNNSYEIDHPGITSIHWDGQSNHGNSVPSGAYFYQIRTAEGEQTRRMELLR